ncbi:RAQPRD family integrative conjugative element protein [Pseudomonas fluorescens]|uniref:Conjugal transfer protein n=1 Tax=Pseudomonas fluorescens TaxID=294 RepID=A0A944DL49_PSEFL|nr:RAQPRD family integrative conjugative element protein [Pseudomonas fluorescens]MBT2298206.1 conjugal transfer protein [Pseudomonas fluorescens]MBT2309671.1 conjugal transfer protein [Pseudomonas fluorescens]MBT2314834.1 conjugal transfer protein [Pseudomonas fluorescens]MBT2327740.1 conjugal transfer protein [Pseudomonas fluorescens]MBT2345487.1 conjugal transfer protein [Pseudomonas fluorescens]
MSTVPIRIFIISLVAVHCASTAAGEQEQKLNLLTQQLDILVTLAQQASRYEAPESGMRYRFDYPRLIQDIQSIRLGVKGYLSPSRAQPRDPGELVGDYRLDASLPEPSP